MKLDAPPLPDWLARLVPARRYLVDVGKRMHVMETGEGPPVVMLHGNPTWGFLYHKVWRELDGFRVIVPDLIGLGLSEKPGAAAHTLANHQLWMTRLFAELAIDRAVVVIQDWGGPVGLGALASRHDLHAGLVILNTAIGPPRRDFRQSAFHRFARLPIVSDAIFKLLGFPQNTISFAQGDWRSIDAEARRAYRYPLRRIADRIAPLALARMVPNSFEHPSIPALERCQDYIDRFEGPAAIVWGDRDPVLGRVRSHVERCLPRAAVTRTQAGHFLQEEVPVEIAAAVRNVARQLFA
jgi:cis-3-alkyl-4-acyloxetan-2-one decarboxylase